MSTKYPMYRVSQWIDTSEEAMNKPMATIIYGVQTMRQKGGPWMHVANGSDPMFFDSQDKALRACEELRKGPAVSGKPDEWAKFMAWRDDYSRHSDPCAWSAWQAALATQAEAHAAELAEAREQLSAHDAIRAQLEAERDALLQQAANLCRTRSVDWQIDYTDPVSPKHKDPITKAKMDEAAKCADAIEALIGAQ